MASRMVFSSNGVCGFAGAAEMPVTVYPVMHDGGCQLSIAWSLSIDSAKQLAAALLAAIEAIEKAPPVQACARCGSAQGVQISNDKGCTHCPNFSSGLR